jgi:DNA-3-methyladenine glycosylase I
VPRRCEWVADDDPLFVAYHDLEWGVPSHDDRHLFELLTLEGAQAGLSWATILRKREGYRSSFAQFDPGRVARFNRRRIVSRRRQLRDLPSETKESKTMSKDLKQRGFRFIGSTVCYSFMQAAGLANDHVTSCFRYRELVS